MKYSPFFFFVFFFFVCFSKNLKTVKSIFSLQTVLRQVDGWIWPVGLGLPLPDVNKPLWCQKFLAQCSRKVRRLFFFKRLIAKDSEECGNLKPTMH